MCRKFHGASFASLCSVHRKGFKWKSGEDVLVDYTAANGTTRTFCGTCGSSLFFSSPRADSNILEIALGLFDDEIPVIPNAHIFVGSAANWTCIADDLRQYEESRRSAELGKT